MGRRRLYRTIAQAEMALRAKNAEIDLLRAENDALRARAKPVEQPDNKRTGSRAVASRVDRPLDAAPISETYALGFLAV